MEDLNTADISEESRLILLHSILDSVTAAKRNAEGRRITTCLTEPCLLTDNKLYITSERCCLYNPETLRKEKRKFNDQTLESFHVNWLIEKF
ncbi:hypothetical protein CWI36_0350p0030 [Hamiltosporidium magnivora]|uniref:Uncharacterized protein n=1 Tax=Hamiltosporidium magnivora TaxID=148818 RepID=A0A4Q9LFY0_9MICR|nr:hypothetical protein CWI36_0350p0030 [Hamiltosporidium magnivora]